VQSGFVGRWGEGYYTTHYGNNGTVTAADWANRKAIVDTLLGYVPGRMVGVRTPLMKRTMYGTAPVSASDAYSAAPLARVGHVNDCFLRNPTDSGTYHDPAVELPYLQADSQFVPVGGETCGVRQPTDTEPDRTDRTTALPELARFHWSYLNQDYHPAVIAKWIAQSAKPEVERRLGYRFSFSASSIPTTAASGTTMTASVTVRNTGWATPFNFRPVYLVLRNTQTHKLFVTGLKTDPRRWTAGASSVVSLSVGIPANLDPGQYDVLLNLPDASPALAGDPRYAIQFATDGVWEPTTGYNSLLRRVTVTG
jgi:hypothetical protein